MKKIEITTSNTYKGQKDGSWTEQYQGSFTLDQETTFAHKSGRAIKAFQAGVITCVYASYESAEVFNAPTKKEVESNIIADFTQGARPDNTDDFVYAITLPKGTEILQYGVNELRFVMPIDAQVSLIGKQGPVRVSDPEKYPYETRVYGGKTINVWTKK